MNIVSEYCDNKTIAEYFRNNAPHDYKDITLYTKDPDNIFPMLCKFASEIARGMEFISSKQSYADISWSGDFPELLASGFRLPSPKLGNNEIYSMLLKCWNNDPKLRPSFTQLAMFFEGIVSQDYYMEV
ncbi:Platelet-derived growth factor receptor alpha, partial [Orchesella cincta]